MIGEITKFAERAEAMIAERDKKLAEAAAFLDRLAERLHRVEDIAANCRAMANKLRGEA